METKRELIGAENRSETYSARHRNWGWDAPCTDIDAIESDGGLAQNCVFNEYSNHTGVQKTYAVMEIKAAPSERINSDYGKRQMEALVSLARVEIPVFGVEWRIDHFDQSWFFAVFAANDAARAALGTDAATMNERQFVMLQYRLRGLEAPTSIIAALPDEETPRCFFDYERDGKRVRQPPHFKCSTAA